MEKKIMFENLKVWENLKTETMISGIDKLENVTYSSSGEIIIPEQYLRWN